MLPTYSNGSRLNLGLGVPVVQTDDFLYFAALVSVLVSFGRTLLGLAEGVFCTADGLVDEVKRFRHTAFFF